MLSSSSAFSSLRVSDAYSFVAPRFGYNADPSSSSSSSLVPLPAPPPANNNDDNDFYCGRMRAVRCFCCGWWWVVRRWSYVLRRWAGCLLPRYRHPTALLLVRRRRSGRGGRRQR